MSEYNTDTRRLQGGSVIEIATNGEIRINGGVITNNGTQAAAIADVPTAGSATAADNATAINAILAALRGAGVIAAS